MFILHRDHNALAKSQVNINGWVDCAFTCQAGSTRILVWVSLLAKLASTFACHLLLAWGMSGRWACCIHAYIVYTPIAGKGRCRHQTWPLGSLHLEASKCAGERTTLALKPMGRVSIKSKIGTISGPTKWTLVQQKFLKSHVNWMQIA